MSDHLYETPGDALQRMLNERGWTHDYLAELTRRPRPAITEIITNKRGISAEMAHVLGAVFGVSPTYWLLLDSASRLSVVPDGLAEIQNRVKLYSLAPVKEMQRRGWIRTVKELPELEQELKTFFDSDLSEEPKIGAATRKSDAGEPLSLSQRAWCFRVRQLAKDQMVSKCAFGLR